jgi:hypothetical protein
MMGNEHFGAGFRESGRVYGRHDRAYAVAPWITAAVAGSSPRARQLCKKARLPQPRQESCFTLWRPSETRPGALRHGYASAAVYQLRAQTAGLAAFLPPPLPFLGLDYPRVVAGDWLRITLIVPAP